MRHLRPLSLVFFSLALASYTQFNSIPESHSQPVPQSTGFPGLANLSNPNTSETVPQQSPASVNQSSTSQSETIVSNFEGLNYGGLSPPDVQVASDGAYVMEIVNTNVGIWTRQGSLVQTISLSEFWGPGFSTRIYDSRVLYDSQSGRWFVSSEDFSTGLVLLRVSKTGNPTGNWWTYFFQPPAGCPDQPLLGLSDDKLSIWAHSFTDCSFGSYLGAEYWIFDKNSLLNGSPVYTSFGPDSSLFQVQQVQSLTPTSTLYMVSFNPGGYSVRLYSVDGLPPDPLTITFADLPTSGLQSPPQPVQLGTNLLLDPGFGLDAKWFQGKLWLSTIDGCIPPGDSQWRTCLRLVQIDTSAYTVQQEIELGAMGKYYFYPALSIDGLGNLVVVFGFSSAQDYPGIMVTTQATGDPVNTLETPIVIMSGSYSETTYCTPVRGCRYGDYFGAGPDPSDPRVVWVAGEYGTPNGWSTRIAALYAFPVMNAIQSGWNSITPPLTYDPCTSTITTDCNPPIVELNGVRFVLRILWQDNVGNSHRFAIYTQGTSPDNVTSTDPCNITNTNGCLASSGTIDYTNQTTTITFTPTISSNFTGPGTYEYYCQFHPSTMHGKIIVYKNPDLNNNGKISLPDIATVARAFGSTPTSQNWNINADLDNNGRVDILDVAIAAFYYTRYIYAL